ncbi:hypothetical protein JTE90_023260 [Oedothorax gibbosus]|uniref:Uncharacterized protein n=1 Tax=Oedothorax gibbosus TaxID=931172 RepID=A0AAV6TXY3_9ARAC|nr:hypothetical protein JTE90_023260 [Oedothorax gibbosus]
MRFILIVPFRQKRTKGKPAFFAKRVLLWNLMKTVPQNITLSGSKSDLGFHLRALNTCVSMETPFREQRPSLKEKIPSCATC